MQSLVYVFIGSAALALGAAAYLALSLTPVEAGLLALVAFGLGVIAQERVLRRRTEARLQKAISELTRLLSADAQAGQVLSQRINKLTDINAASRLDVIEADVSVLGTVVRQVAEAVAALEDTLEAAEAQRAARNKGATTSSPPLPPSSALASPQLQSVGQDGAGRAEAHPIAIEPRVSVAELEQALLEQRITVQSRPIVTLPQRRVHGQDLGPQLVQRDGEVLSPFDFLPRRGGETALRRIDRLLCDQAIALARRARGNGPSPVIYVPLSRASLSERGAMDGILASLDGNRALSPCLVFALSEIDWRALARSEREPLRAVVDKGFSLSLSAARTLKLDFGDLSGEGVRSVQVDASRFIDDPQSLTDFHSADIANYVRRFGIELILTGIRNEAQVLAIIEDNVGLGQGDHLAPAISLPTDVSAAQAAPVEALHRARS